MFVEKAGLGAPFLRNAKMREVWEFARPNQCRSSLLLRNGAMASLSFGRLANFRWQIFLVSQRWGRPHLSFF
jgi:hypothetical protein